MVDKYLYSTTFSQSFSPCGYFLAAGNNYGEVAIYNLKSSLASGDSHEVMVNHNRPLCVLQLHKEGAALSLASTSTYLLSGGSGEIHGWDWKALQGKNQKLSWTIQLPTNKDTLEKPDANIMKVQEDTNHLYVGGGDNNVHIFDLECGKLLRVLSGHDDYIHSVDLQGTNCASASDDGSVRMWDTRQFRVVNTIVPSSHSHLSRPKIGKWIGAVAINEDWMVCGGGPLLCLWHLRSLSPTTPFQLDDSGIHVADFCEDRIVAGGASPSLYHLNYNGDVAAQVPTSSTCIYSVVFQEQPIKVLSAGGSSSKLDICTNFNYREQTFQFGLS